MMNHIVNYRHYKKINQNHEKPQKKYKYNCSLSKLSNNKNDTKRDNLSSTISNIKNNKQLNIVLTGKLCWIPWGLL